MLTHQTYLSWSDGYFSDAKWNVEEEKLIIKYNDVDNQEYIMVCDVNISSNILTIIMKESQYNQSFEGFTVFKYQRN